MKRGLICFIGFWGGIAIGWYLGHTQPLAKAHTEVQEQYRFLRDTMGMTDAEILEHGSKSREYLGAVEASDERAAALALEILPEIERGNDQQAKLCLSSNIAYYYRLHRTDSSYSNLVTRIEKLAEKLPIVAAELSKETL